MTTNPLLVRSRVAYSWLVCGASWLQSPFLLIVRLYWGWQFFNTGSAKLGNVDGFTQHFTEWGVPFPHFSVLMAGNTEKFCGLLLLVGIFSRLISIPLIFTMIVAYLTAEKEALHSIFSDPDKFVSAAPFLFMFAAVIVFIFGPGFFSLDTLLGKIFGAPASDPEGSPARA